APCPHSLAASLAALPSMSLIPFAPFAGDTPAATVVRLMHRKPLTMRERNSESYLKSELRTSKVLTLCSRSLETRSRPRFLAATLATLPSMSLFPKAPFDLSVCLYVARVPAAPFASRRLRERGSFVHHAVSRPSPWRPCLRCKSLLCRALGASR